MPNSSIWLVDMALPGATTPGQSGPGSDSNERVLQIPRSSRVRASPSDGLMSYPGHSLRRGLTPRQKWSWHILQPQPTGLLMHGWCMDVYWSINNHVDIWSLWWNKTLVLPSSSHVSTTVWHFGFNETPGKGTLKKSSCTATYVSPHKPSK